MKFIQKFKRIIQPYLFALKVVWVSSKKWTFFRGVIILSQSVLPLVSLYLLKLVLDKVVKEEVLSGEGFDEILFYLILLGASLLFIAIANLLAQFVTETQQQLVSDHMSILVQKKALKLDLSYYENPKYLNTYFQAQKEALFRPVQIVSSLMDSVQHGVSLILIAGFLTFLHYGVALVLVLSVLPAIFIRYHFSKKLFQWQKDRIAREREAHYINRVITSEEYVKEMKIFDAGKNLMSAFSKIRKILYTEKFRINKLRTNSSILAKIVETGAEIATYIYITHQTYQGVITIGDLVIYFQAFQRGKMNLTNTLESMVKLRENKLFLSYIADFLNFKPVIEEPNVPKPVPEVIKQGLRFENVSFTYPDHENRVLSDISLNLEKGKITAIVGENGSGKSTLVKLVCRLYDPSTGKVLLDGHDLRAYNSGQLQKKMTVIFQDFAHYFFTVKENIGWGSPESEQSLDKIKAASGKTGADAFIEEFPNQYDQKLGRAFAGGRELSIGQWQKIALSRAFFKDTEVIIVDEPTSAIDPLAEHKIFDFLNEVSKDKIVILITHRLYNLKMADQIVVMDQGKIKEVGSHEELLKLEGEYCKMLEKQLA